MQFNELMQLSEKELNKITKEKLVKTIVDGKWHYTSLTERVAEAPKVLNEQRQAEDNAKLLLAGYLGVEVSSTTYDDNYFGNLSLLTLIGQVLAHNK